MMLRLWVLGLLLVSCCLPAKANELLSYDAYSLKSFGRVQIFIPKDHSQDRIYVKTRFKKPIIKAIALVDDNKLVSAIGTMQTASIPAELAQRFGSNFSDVICFPRTMFQTVQQRIVFGLESNDGKETRINLQGKKLSRILTDLR